MNIQDWANDNDGSIELTGHLAAVSQRYSSIQNQIRQIGALNNLAEAQERQKQESELLEARQNILYDISASLDEIKRLFDTEPARAYYKFLLLEEFVNPLGLEHRMFPGLEWKNHCEKTIRGIADMRAWCDAQLDGKHKQLGADAIARRDQRLRDEEERKKQEEERKRVEAERASKLAHEREVYVSKESLKQGKVLFGFSIFGYIVVSVVFALFQFAPQQIPNQQHFRAVFWLGLIASFVGFVMTIGAVSGSADGQPEAERTKERKLIFYSVILISTLVVMGIAAITELSSS